MIKLHILSVTTWVVLSAQTCYINRTEIKTKLQITNVTMK